MSKDVCSLSAQYVLPAAVVAPTINNTTHGFLSTPLLPHTHNTVWGLKLTLHIFFSNVHYLLSCQRYMYLEMPKTVHPNRPYTTRPNTALMLDLGNFIRLSDSFLITTDARSNLFPGGPWVPWVHSNCTLTAFCFESLSPSEGKARHVCHTLFIIITQIFCHSRYDGYL